MKIFILEDDPERIRWFKERFLKHDLAIIDTCHDIEKFQPPYDLICLDHDLGGRQLEDHEDSGTLFAQLIKNQVGQAKIIIHSYNPSGAARMQDTLNGSFYVPFRGPAFINLINRWVED